VLTVFTGPSLETDAVRRTLPWAQVHPPACRGDVDAAVAAGASTILLIDGGFAHHLAVSPGELVRALHAGARVIGAASLGAIRAAECHPAGLEGFGALARLYRLGVLRDDDEVAVATEPDRGHRAVSLALVNVRFAALAAVRAGLLDRAGAAAVLGAAKAQHFSQRLWPAVFTDAGVRPTRALAALCAGRDVKRRDAERVVAWLAEAGEPAPQPVAPRSASLPRYRGHDPHFGLSRAVLAAELTAWLTASGRYRRYWAEPPDDPDWVWSDLSERRERDHELMRLHAVRRGVELAAEAPGEVDLAPARAQVARAHGFEGWERLCADAAAGSLPPGVPYGDIAGAARCVALARRALCGAT
jgi:hypothetical protein